jgi:hypothetical protein
MNLLSLNSPHFSVRCNFDAAFERDSKCISVLRQEV